MPTYRMLIEYDGTGYNGWQIQAEGPTVQQALEDALEVVLRTRPAVVGSGRTDAGVHARGQVAHFETEKPVDVRRLKRSLNGMLGGPIIVLAVEQAPDGFHARYEAIRRRYRYFVSTEPRALDRTFRVELRPAPDFECMNQAAALLTGTHDFSSFCRTHSETTNRVCTVERAVWVEEDRAGDWYFEMAADRFLHGMVRTAVGTLLQVGYGKRPAGDLRRVLAAKDRRAAGPAAPARGLVLEEVLYPEKAFGG